MTTTSTIYPGDGVTTDFVVPFDYDDIASVNIVWSGGTPSYTFVNAKLIRLSQPLATGQTLSINRVTPIETPVIQLNNGSGYTGSQYNRMYRQVFYSVQELWNKAARFLTKNDAGNYDAGGAKVVNLGHATGDNDATSLSDVHTLVDPVLPAAKTYTDQTAATLTSARAQGDADTLTAAKQYADVGDASTLNTSKSYTDNRVADAIISAGAGNVVGANSSVDNEVPLFSGTTGRKLKNTGILWSTVARLTLANAWQENQTFSKDITITGNATFNGSVTVGTLTPGDNSTKAASSAFVKAAIDTKWATLGNAAFAATTAFATAAQGTKADSAVQPGSLGTAAFKSTGTTIDSIPLVQANGKLPSSLFPRDTLTADRVYYVRTDGNDSNTGLVNNAGGAFKTIQKAVDTVASIDRVIYQVTIQVADGTYAENVVLKSGVGSLAPVLIGNTTTQANVVIAPATGRAVFVDLNSNWVFKGFRMTANNGDLLVMSRYSTLVVNNLDFGPAGTGTHIYVEASSLFAETSAKISISGGGSAHISAAREANLSLGSVTYTITNSPAWGLAFAWVRELAIVFMGGSTFTGTATGGRYNVSMNGAIVVNGAGASFLPGSAVGTAATGGQYA